MKGTIIGWGKITPKKTGKECFLLMVEVSPEQGWNGRKVQSVFCSTDTAKGLDRVKLPIQADFQKDFFTGRLEVVLNA